MKTSFTLIHLMLLASFSIAQDIAPSISPNFLRHVELDQDGSSWDTVAVFNQAFDLSNRAIFQSVEGMPEKFEDKAYMDSIRLFYSGQQLDSTYSFRRLGELGNRLIRVKHYENSQDSVQETSYYVGPISGDRSLEYIQVTAYDNNGREQMQRLVYFDDDEVSYGTLKTLTYHSSGQVQSTQIDEFVQGTRSPYSHMHFHYTNDLLDSSIFTLASDSSWSIVKLYEHGSGRIESSYEYNTWNGNVYPRFESDYAYNTEGLLESIAVSRYETNWTDSGWYAYSNVAYTYDGRGRLIEEETGLVSQPGSKTKYIYEFGNALGIEAVVAERSEVHAFPNPTGGRMQIRTDESILSIEIFDRLGTKMLTSKASTPAEEIDLGALPSGTYFVRVRTEADMHTLPVVKM